jgi:beta-glucosidase
MQVPEEIILGVTTSAHQVEGGNSPSDWLLFEREPGRIRNGHRSDVAADFWNSYEEDIALMSRLGIQSHRLSLSWARIEPEEGRIDEPALERYQAIVNAHQRAGIRVAVTLLHFALPAWLAARGGILAADAEARFASFVRSVVRKLRGGVWQWHTINEPLVHADGGYRRGVWPPARRGLIAFTRAARALLGLHVAAYRAVRELDDAPVGMVHNFVSVRPRRPESRLDRAGARFTSFILNESLVESFGTGRALPPWGFGKRLDGLQDAGTMIGINYYNGISVGLGRWPLIEEGPQESRRTQMGWSACPAGLADVVRVASPLGVPIYVTENGIATDDDAWRQRFLVAHLRRLCEARIAGIDVRGYSVWSWVDNFEWAEGYEMQFGLVAFDRSALRRAPRPSAELYGAICRDRILPEASTGPSSREGE